MSFNSCKQGLGAIYCNKELLQYYCILHIAIIIAGELDIAIIIAGEVDIAIIIAGEVDIVPVL